MGDYQGLVSRGPVFVPFFVRTNDGDTSNRTDVFSAPADFAAWKAVAGKNANTSIPATAKASVERRVRENIARNLRLRFLGRHRPGAVKP